MEKIKLNEKFLCTKSNKYHNCKICHKINENKGNMRIIFIIRVFWE